MRPQRPGIRVAHVVDPTLDAGVEYREADVSGLPLIEPFSQAPGGFHRFAALQAPVFREDDEPQPGYPGGDRLNLCLSLVNRQAERLQALHNGAFPFPQLLRAVGEEGHVIHIAQIGMAA